MIVENVYTSVACNRTPGAADWGPNDLIAFCACNAVAIFNPDHFDSSKIIEILTGHTKRVNTVKWIDENQLISGSDDGTAIVWQLKVDKPPTLYKLLGHTCGIEAVDTICINGELLIATASSDSSVKLWKQNIETKEFLCIQTISMNGGFCLCLCLMHLVEADKILLAIASDNSRINLYVDNGNGYEQTVSLEGHEDWVRGMCVTTTSDGNLMLASGSQDSLVRLWLIATRSCIKQEDNNLVQMEKRIFSVENKLMNKQVEYSVTLESVLYGHDGWIFAVSWNRVADGSLQLLSTSIDKTMIIWTPEEEGLWVEKIRVGELGGNSLGFFGGKFSPNGNTILGHGFHGSFHIWKQSAEDEQLWEPGVVVGGHYGAVRDLVWEPEGEFMLTVSADQTTRVHAQWERYDDNTVTWHEMARPQVHGYDMQCVCALSRYKFASGAEEKIVRTFQAPGNFVENFRLLCGLAEDIEGESILEMLPKGASVPSLGLSNAAVYNWTQPAADDRHVKDQYPDNYFTPLLLDEPPTEETLMQNTLWPEVQKLYGHGYEIYSLAATSDGNVIASACRATNAEHAKIILWDMTTYKQFQKLASHDLTVVQMKFSPNKQFLLSVSRDRRWTLFKNTSPDVDMYNFEVVATTSSTKKLNNGIHKRIIWTCDWTHDSKNFATGSRDGILVAWTDSGVNTETTLGSIKAVSTAEDFSNSITAVAFAHETLASGEYLAAVGLENGDIHIMTLGTNWTRIQVIDKQFSHHLTVKKLSFRPGRDNGDYQLASCGEDHMVRLNNIKFNV